MYQCFEGYATTEPGQISCTLCPSKRANRDHTACVLPDTPASAIEIFYDNTTVPFTVGSDGGNYFLTVYGNGQPTNNTLQITFVTVNQEFGGLNIYGSKETGNPSSFNFQYFGIGSNASIFDPKMDFNDITVYYFFALDYLPQAKYVPKIFPFYTTSYKISSNKFKISQVDYIYQENQIIFTKDLIAVGTRVLVKFRLLNADSIPSYQLLYSSASNEYYPNPNNADYVVRGKKSDISILSVPQSRGGPFIFSLYLPSSAHGIGIEFELVF